MKIIISPSKTMDMKYVDYKKDNISYPDKTCELVELIKKYNKEEISKVFKIKNNILDNTYNMYQNFNINKGHAISSYSGLVYKGLEFNLYKQEEFDYINDNILILSALYGILKPFSEISQYRLDMTNKPNNQNLYKFWNIENDIKEEVIINLASNEFSKMIEGNIINVVFNEEIEGELISKATYSKKLRGEMLNYLIKNKVTSSEKIKNFESRGYFFNATKSDKNRLIFTKKCIFR